MLGVASLKRALYTAIARQNIQGHARLVLVYYIGQWSVASLTFPPTAHAVNRYVDTTQPWALAKGASSRPQLEATLAALARTLARQCVLLHSFVPGKADELWRQLGGPASVGDQRFASMERLDVSGWRVSKGAGLFPKDQPRQ